MVLRGDAAGAAAMTGEAMTDETVPEPGIYQGVSDTVYRSWERFGFVNQSWLKIFARSKAHARHARLEPSAPTSAMELGTGVHAAVLEPDRFERGFVQGLDLPRRSNADKASHAAFASEHAGKEILSAKDYEHAIAMRDACWRDPLVSSLLKGPGQNEVSIVWDDAEFSMRCMARIDRVTQVPRPVGSGIDTWLFDLKTARDASEDGFRKAMGNLDYHIQAAFYKDGLEAVSPHYRRFGFIVVENTPPFVPAVYELCADDLDQGREEYRELLKLCKEARMSDEWPGYAGKEIKPIELPRWRQRGRDLL